MADFDFEQFRQDVLEGVSNAADAVSSAAKGAGDEVKRFRHFNEVGRDLFVSGSTTSHGGNLSECDGSTIWITKSGTMLGHLMPGDIVDVGWEFSVRDTPASMELVVHRAIYHALAELDAQAQRPFAPRAVIHAHTKYTVLRSLVEDTITPQDSEGRMLLGETVPVLAVEPAVASEKVAEALATHVREGGRIAVIKGHGPFAIADTLEEAYRLISCLEYSSELATHLDMLKKM